LRGPDPEPLPPVCPLHPPPSGRTCDCYDDHCHDYDLMMMMLILLMIIMIMLMFLVMVMMIMIFMLIMLMIIMLPIMMMAMMMIDMNMTFIILDETIMISMQAWSSSQLINSFQKWHVWH
jgi:hypothetical protein